ncbi:MAG: glycosyltransferase family 87 protein, partial [Candidatus Acidiferrum sp.]
MIAPMDGVRRTNFWTIFAASILAIACIALFARQARVTGLPLRDFAEYWAAGRLISAGENPYDPARIGHLEQAAGRDGDGLLMWNPPWTIPFTIPFGFLPPHTAHALWLLLQFITIAMSATAIWRFYGGSYEHRGRVWLATFTFAPVFLTLYLGQITAFLLAGAVLFLVLERQGNDLAAGVVTLLLAIKPHLF